MIATGHADKLMALLHELLLLPTESNIGGDIWDLLIRTCGELRTQKRRDGTKRRADWAISMEQLNTLVEKKLHAEGGTAYRDVIAPIRSLASITHPNCSDFQARSISCRKR